MSVDTNAEAPPPEEEAAIVEPLTDAVEQATAAKRIAWGVLLLAIAYAIQAAAGLVLSIVVAILFALLLAPAVKGLNRVGLPAPVGAAVVVVLLLVVIGALAMNLYEPARRWATLGPRDVRMLETKIRNLTRPVQSIKEAADKVAGMSGAEKQKPREVVVERSGSELLVHVQEALVAMLTTIMLVYFLLASGDTFLRKAVRVIPRLRDKITAVEIARDVQQQIGRYFMTITMMSAGLGAATATAMWLLDMPTPLLWGVLAGLLNFIPYLGPIIALVAISVVALFTFTDTLSMVLPPAVFLMLHFIEGQLLEPLVMGGRFEMNPVIIFVWVLLWGWLGGAIGVLIAVPLLVAIRICASHIPSLTPLAEMISRD
jgi:predicted PurR-regulated permease PerM